MASEESGLAPYRELVRKMADQQDGRPFIVRGRERTSIVIEQLFRSARREMLILADDFNAPEYVSPLVIKAAVNFLLSTRDANLRVISLTPISAAHQLIRRLEREHLSHQISVRSLDSSEITTASFTTCQVADGHSYRIQREHHRNVDATVAFGDAVVGAQARSIFDSVFALSFNTADWKQTAPALAVSGIIVPEARNSEGTLIKSTSAFWAEIVSVLGNDWSEAYKLSPENWEEIIAGAFKRAGYDEVTLTKRSGDHGRDVIAVRRGIGCVKIIGSVKAYGPGRLVPYDSVRSLLGVLSGEQDASKGVITTTSDFHPRTESDPFIKPFIPTRLELVNGKKLQAWLLELAKGRPD